MCRWVQSLNQIDHKNRVLPVHCAARKGALPVLRFLAQRGADLRGARDNGQWTLLHHAAAGGCTSVLEALLLGGLLPPSSEGPRAPAPPLLDVDVRAGDGSTPLLIAVVEAHLPAVRYVFLISGSIF